MQSVTFTRQTLLKHEYMDNVTDIVFFIVCKKIFLFGFIEAFDSKGINTLKRYHVSHQVSANVATFTFTT